MKVKPNSFKTVLYCSTKVPDLWFRAVQISVCGESNVDHRSESEWLSMTLWVFTFVNDQNENLPFVQTMEVVSYHWALSLGHPFFPGMVRLYLWTAHCLTNAVFAFLIRKCNLECVTAKEKLLVFGVVKMHWNKNSLEKILS